MRRSGISSCLLLLLLGIVINFVMNVAQGPNMTVVDYSCSENSWGGDQVYAQLVEDVIDDVWYRTRPNYADYSTESYGDDVAYGFGACNGAISAYECYYCLGGAQNYLTNACGEAIGGKVEMVDCKMRCENYDFYP